MWSAIQCRCQKFISESFKNTDLTPFQIDHHIKNIIFTIKRTDKNVN